MMNDQDLLVPQVSSIPEVSGRVIVGSVRLGQEEAVGSSGPQRSEPHRFGVVL